MTMKHQCKRSDTKRTKENFVRRLIVDYTIGLYGVGRSISWIVLCFFLNWFVCLRDFSMAMKLMDFFLFEVTIFFYCRILCCVLIWHFRLLFLLFSQIFFMFCIRRSDRSYFSFHFISFFCCFSSLRIEWYMEVSLCAWMCVCVFTNALFNWCCISFGLNRL